MPASKRSTDKSPRNAKSEAAGKRRHIGYDDYVNQQQDALFNLAKSEPRGTDLSIESNVDGGKVKSPETPAQKRPSKSNSGYTEFLRNLHGNPATTPNKVNKGRDTVKGQGHAAAQGQLNGQRAPPAAAMGAAPRDDDGVTITQVQPAYRRIDSDPVEIIGVEPARDCEICIYIFLWPA